MPILHVISRELFVCQVFKNLINLIVRQKNWFKNANVNNQQYHKTWSNLCPLADDHSEVKV